MSKNVYRIINEQRLIHIEPEIKKAMKDAIDLTLKEENIENKCEISIVLTNNKKIHVLNKEARGVDRATDVLSFPIISDDDSIGDIDIGTGNLILGDIVISAERAKEQSEMYGHSLKREMAFLCVHSTLHLLGYDHETSKEDEIYMNEKQEEILTKLNITRD